MPRRNEVKDRRFDSTWVAGSVAERGWNGSNVSPPERGGGWGLFGERCGVERNVDEKCLPLGRRDLHACYGPASQGLLGGGGARVLARLEA